MTAPVREIILAGLDGQNPLGFLATLGLLRVLDDHAARRRAPAPTVRFTIEGPPVPVLRTDLGEDQLAELVIEDAVAQADNRALQLAYAKDGTRVLPTAEDAIRDLKPPPPIARQLLSECAQSTRRASSLGAAWFSELVQDNNGNTKPGALHFTAGQQVFLGMVEDLRTGLTVEDVREALFGPWLNRSSLPSLSWDASVARNYALRATDPSKEKRGSVPAANWLGVIALEFFPVVPDRGRLITTAVTGGWKDSTFHWVLWNVQATVRAAASLLRVDARRWSASERSALGILRVYAADILRSDQGGYGTFSPASVVAPSTR
jgi:hypothetical protein